MTSACYCHVVENGDSISDDNGVNGSLLEGCNDAGFLADVRHSPQINGHLVLFGGRELWHKLNTNYVVLITDYYITSNSCKC